jgi:hypothetical protein
MPYIRLKMGITMQVYIHRLKISKAKELLLQTNHTIGEIASSWGSMMVNITLSCSKGTNRLHQKSSATPTIAIFKMH